MRPFPKSKLTWPSALRVHARQYQHVIAERRTELYGISTAMLFTLDMLLAYNSLLPERSL
jgi:hypothetical protein